MGDGEYVYGSWAPLMEFDPNSLRWDPLRRADPSLLRQRFAPLPREVEARTRADADRAGGDAHFHPRR
eukprot:9908483-Alexandrium_andersonii.AAC.1